MVSSSSSPSFKRCHKKPVSLSSLPDDLLLEISSYVGASSSSPSDIKNLKLVSKSFRRLCDDRYFLRRLSPSTVRSFHIFGKFSDKITKIVESGNPEALYSKGVTDYFHQGSDDQQRDRAIGYITKAAEEGHQNAQYLNGIISICLGGKTKQKGFEILSSFKKLSMSETMRKMETIRKEITGRIWCYQNAMMKKLKESYVREKCRCDGRFEKFINKQACLFWSHDDDIIISSACDFCLWHHEVQHFLDA